MQHNKFTRTVQKHCLWLSLLIHSLLLATYVVVLPVSMLQSKPSEPMPSYVPSYVQNSDPQSPSESSVDAINDEKADAKKVVADKETEVDKIGIEKPKTTKQKQVAKQAPKSPPSQQAEFSRNLVPEELSDPNNKEQMHLIGETKIIKPIIKILSKALQQHLIYPKIAQDFNLRGTVLVGFVLHPQGYVTETKIVKSSGAGVLDDAARNAVNGMSPLQGVGSYLKKSEFMVVGIIFG